jgi:Protein of unknown function (DUF1569)
MPERRLLNVTSLEEVMPEVEKLSAGYEPVGQWSLGQICNHLTTSLNFVTNGVTGASLSNAPEDPRFALIRARFFRAGRFPDGKAAPVSELVPRTGLDDRAEVEALRDALARYALATGPFPAHPYLGFMTKEEWSQFHCLHAAHHLGFAVPLEPG